LGYAPFYLYPLTIVALAGLFRLWQHAATARGAAWLGFWFGFGQFGAGVSWIYISLHDFGGMPMLPAALATAAFCAFLALFPATAGYLAARLFPRHMFLALPLLWVLLEWVREWLFTGFPWLAVGYSQIPYSPLAGIAPLLGIHGVSLATASCAALIATWRTKRLSARRLTLALVAFWLGGSALLRLEWSTPHGKPLSFSLLQGNIAQDLKWHPDELQHTLETYRSMVKTSRARLIVLPEMAFPVLPKQLPPGYLEELAEHARSLGGNLLIGVPEAARHDGTTDYYNSMLSAGTAPTQVYRKSHLVPFGEFIPFKPALGWIYRDLLHIPMADLTPGPPHPMPMVFDDQNIAVNICYEDVFGSEIIRQLPQATLLVNVSNDAWYGNSLAAHQHLQMSQARAMETARVVLRATNTGATAAIGHDGRVIAELPHFTTASLDGEAQGRTGATPYVRWGNLPAIGLIFLGLGVLWGRKKK
jgi:apolipoprotein N-acyltransferase